MVVTQMLAVCHDFQRAEQRWFGWDWAPRALGAADAKFTVFFPVVSVAPVLLVDTEWGGRRRAWYHRFDTTVRLSFHLARARAVCVCRALGVWGQRDDP